MPKDNYSEVIARAMEILEGSGLPHCIAVLCSDDQYVKFNKAILMDNTFNVLRLDSSALKHILKRQLNQHGSTLIFYSIDHENMVYEILNDGSTLLSDGILIK